jgi:hypothetical protein
MLLHTAVTAAFHRSSRKAAVLRHPHMAEGCSPSSSSKPARGAATNLLRQHQDGTVDTHFGHPPCVKDPSPQAQGQARGDPDLARGGPDQARLLPPVGSRQESTIAPSMKRRPATAHQGLPWPSLVAATSTHWARRRLPASPTHHHDDRPQCSPSKTASPPRPPPCSGSPSELAPPEMQALRTSTLTPCLRA